MTGREYLEHYTKMPQLLAFLAVTFGIVAISHLILGLCRKHLPGMSKKTGKHLYELYDELMFSATSILLFSGVYFLMEFGYFDLPAKALQFWKDYRDFLLLGGLVLSILFVDLFDGVLVPLKRISDTDKNALRLAGILYMLVIFAYIKFIYEDNNYDAIIVYFLLMIIGRFVYFDASFKGFVATISECLRMLPLLLMVLVGTSLAALYGFSGLSWKGLSAFGDLTILGGDGGNGYLLRKNGVVVSLFLAQFSMLVWIFVLTHVSRVMKWIKEKR